MSRGRLLVIIWGLKKLTTIAEMFIKWSLEWQYVWLLPTVVSLRFHFLFMGMEDIKELLGSVIEVSGKSRF